MIAMSQDAHSAASPHIATAKWSQIRRNWSIGGEKKLVSKIHPVVKRARSSLISLFCSATGFVVKAARQGSGECQFARLLAAVLCFGY